MDTPLYKLYLFKRGPLFYQLQDTEWDELRAKIAARGKELGIRDLFNAEMSWSNEQYEYFGVEFCPSLEAAREYTNCLRDFGYFRYIESESFLGIPMDNTFPDFTPPPPGPEENPVYRVYLSHERDLAHQIPAEALEQHYTSTQEAFRWSGAKTVLSAYARWNNETYEYFGIERFPSMEALIAYTQYLSSNGWYQVMASRSYLGTAFGGMISGV